MGEPGKLLSRWLVDDQLRLARYVWEGAMVLQTFRDYDGDDLNRSAHHHMEIVEAIEAGDGEWAASVMHSHVMAARRAFRNKHQRDS